MKTFQSSGKSFNRRFLIPSNIYCNSEFGSLTIPKRPHNKFLKSQVSSQTQPACTHIRECQGLGSGTPRRPAGYMPRAPARPVATAAAAAVPIIYAYAHVYIYARIGVTCENSNSKGHRQEDRTRGNRESHNNLCLLSRGDLRIPVLRISHYVTEE